jgi:hypothetical protein
LENEVARAAQPERNRTKGSLLVGLGLLIILLGACLMLALRYAPVFGLQRPGETTAIILVLVGTAAAWMGFRIIARGHKLRTVDGDEVIATSEKKPVLYLRSFALDQDDNDNTFHIYGGITAPINPFESALAWGFSDAGPLVAIGRPGETFATTGAARIYVRDDEWQAKVFELAEEAAFVVWTYGKSDGLRWEIGELVGRVPPEKLVIALPYWEVPPRKRGPLWSDAVSTIGHVFPKPLPASIGDSLFIAFDKDWTPIPIKGRPPHILIRTMALGGWNRIIQGIRGLLDLRGIPYRKPGLGFLIFAAFITLLWIAFLLLFVLMIYGGFIRDFVEIEGLENLPRSLTSIF